MLSPKRILTIVAILGVLVAVNPANAQAVFPHRRPHLPPQGWYYSCQPVYALSMCEQRDQESAQMGFKLSINFIGMASHLSSKQNPGSSLEDWLAYDSTIGFQQVLAIGHAIKDGLSGSSLIGDNPWFASDCASVPGGSGYPATNNQQFVKCMTLAIASYSPAERAAVRGIYLYDEPGCPNASKGYCQGSITPDETPNVAAIATEWNNDAAAVGLSIPVTGANTPSGVPNCAGGWSGSCAQGQENDLYSWLLNPTTPFSGYDYYPIGGSPNEAISDIGLVGTLIQNVVAGMYPAEKLTFVAQAFSWQDYNYKNCGPNYPACAPWPTGPQIRAMRDQALYYAWAGGNPLWSVFYYSQDDVDCRVNAPPGCDPVANRTALKKAAFAPFPTQPPPLRTGPPVMVPFKHSAQRFLTQR